MIFFGGNKNENRICKSVDGRATVRRTNKSLKKRKAVFLTGVENTKFKKMTTPGDILKLKVKVISNRKNFYKFSATAHVEDALVASSDFSAMLQS